MRQPLQVSNLDYNGVSGMQSMDYKAPSVTVTNKPKMLLKTKSKTGVEEIANLKRSEIQSAMVEAKLPVPQTRNQHLHKSHSHGRLGIKSKNPNRNQYKLVDFIQTSR